MVQLNFNSFSVTCQAFVSFQGLFFLVKRICFPKFEGSRWCDDGAVDKIVDARVRKGEWWQLGGEELLVECTEGIKRKNQQNIKRGTPLICFCSNFPLTMTQYSDRCSDCMWSFFLKAAADNRWSCSCGARFAREPTLDASRARSIHPKWRSASCWRQCQGPNIIILSS